MSKTFIWEKLILALVSTSLAWNQPSVVQGQSPVAAQPWDGSGSEMNPSPDSGHPGVAQVQGMNSAQPGGQPWVGQGANNIQAPVIGHPSIGAGISSSPVPDHTFIGSNPGMSPVTAVMPPGLPKEECARRIYQDCNQQGQFTDEELENVRQYLYYQFTVLADIKPNKPVCPQLYVRQDWKCLTPVQKQRLINVWRIMYLRGDIQRLADFHAKYWPAWHKSAEIFPAHRWLNLEFERIMQSIDPGVALPYWDAHLFGAQPERSTIWDLLGHSGNYQNGYEVPDGLYPQLDLVPTIKRHWSPNGTILPWATPEFMTRFVQSSSYPDLLFSGLSPHFQTHLNIGGYEGQYSYSNAPLDILYFLHHNAQSDIGLLKWQLRQREFLTPFSYNGMYAFDKIDGKMKASNILTDTLTGLPFVTVKETFWVGFGDNCFIPDQLVRPINNLMKGIPDPVPTAIKRLPDWVVKKHFTSLYYGNFSALAHNFEEVGECNNECRPLPRPTLMRETEQGRHRLSGYKYDNGIDESQYIDQSEQLNMVLLNDLQQSGYCSPYVTSY